MATGGPATTAPPDANLQPVPSSLPQAWPLQVCFEAPRADRRVIRLEGCACGEQLHCSASFRDGVLDIDARLDPESMTFCTACTPNRPARCELPHPLTPGRDTIIVNGTVPLHLPTGPSGLPEPGQCHPLARADEFARWFGEAPAVAVIDVRDVRECQNAPLPRQVTFDPVRFARGASLGITAADWGEHALDLDFSPGERFVAALEPAPEVPGLCPASPPSNGVVKLLLAAPTADHERRLLELLASPARGSERPLEKPR